MAGKPSRPRALAVLILAITVAAGLSTPMTASAASTVTSVSAAPCVLVHGPASCQSTNPFVTIDLASTQNASVCTARVNVNWGDGTIDTIVIAGPDDGTEVLDTHTYKNPGVYSVTTSGTNVSGPAGCEFGPNSYQFILGASPTACPPVEFIGVRGSGQSSAGYDGMGPEIDHVAQALKSALGTSGGKMKLVAVNYPADSVDDLSPSAAVVSLAKSGHLIAAEALYEKTSLAKYDASIDKGFNAIMTDIHAVVTACPSTRIVLAGYSQGAIVVHEAESWIAGHLNSQLSHIAGTVLVGDPDRITDTKAKMFGTATAKAEGVRVYLGAIKAQDVIIAAETATIANKDDISADFGFSNILTQKSRDAAIAVHTGYAREVDNKVVYDPALAKAADWIESLIATGK
jgi:Cutinase